MNTKELTTRLLDGEMFTTAEWRSSIAKKSVIEDERTEERREQKTVVHQVEFKDFKTKTEMPFEVTEVMPLTLDVDNYNSKPRPFRKGERVIIEVKSFGWSQNKNRYIGKGVIHAIDKEATKA